ncbi:MAG: hypothetical protein ACREJB_17785 [Planctomycetaceae bacterium]
MTALRRLMIGLALALTAGATGCELLHDLQLHRLHRLNRGPGMSSDAYLSVPDPLPEEFKVAPSLPDGNFASRSDAATL